MKSNRIREEKQNFALLCLVLLLLLTAPFFLSGCEREAVITIENQRSQDVKIYHTFVHADGTLGEATYQGTISANSTKTQYIILIYDYNVKRIEAIEPSGKIVFSQDYNRADLEKIKWKIVIPP